MRENVIDDVAEATLGDDDDFDLDDDDDDVEETLGDDHDCT